MLVGELVDAVMNEWLVGTWSAAYNQLDQAVGPTDTQFKLTFEPNGPAVGSLLSLYDELCQVIDVNPTARTVQVLRGVRGTVKAAHGRGELVEANPRYWRALVRDSARRDLRSWPHQVYRTESVRMSLGSGDLAINVQPSSQLPVRKVLAVRRTGLSPMDPRTFSPTFTSAVNVHTKGDCYVYLDTPTGAAADAVVHLATDFNVGSRWDDLTDLDDVGLTESQADALIVGATWRLVTGKEVRRLQLEAQGQSRTPQEVPAGAHRQLGLTLKAIRDDLLEDEIARLVHEANRL